MALLNYSTTLVGGSPENVNTITQLLEEARSSINSIHNAQIASDAAIAYSKLNLVGQLLPADLAAAFALAVSKLTLNSGQLIVGNGSNVGQARTPAGDLTMDNTGNFQLGAGVVGGTELASGVFGAAKVGILDFVGATYSKSIPDDVETPLDGAAFSEVFDSANRFASGTFTGGREGVALAVANCSIPASATGNKRELRVDALGATGLQLDGFDNNRAPSGTDPTVLSAVGVSATANPNLPSLGFTIRQNSGSAKVCTGAIAVVCLGLAT